MQGRSNLYWAERREAQHQTQPSSIIGLPSIIGLRGLSPTYVLIASSSGLPATTNTEASDINCDGTWLCTAKVMRRVRRFIVYVLILTAITVSVLSTTARADWYYEYTDAVATSSYPIGQSVSDYCMAQYSTFVSLYGSSIQSRYRDPDPITLPNTSGTYDSQRTKTAGNCRYDVWSRYSSPPQWLLNGSFASYYVNWAWCEQPKVWVPGHGCSDVSFYVVAKPLPQAQCDSCERNSVADPIGPANGAMFNSIRDIETPAFGRYYNSADSFAGSFSSSWRHSYSRHVVAQASSVVSRPYVSGAESSSLYSDPATACTGGFAEIQAQVSQWSGATANYTDGNCQLTNNDTTIGTLTVYLADGSFVPAHVPVAFDVIRDDGQLIRFPVINGVTTAPPGVSLQLAQTATGFTLTDGNNSAEQYDTNGKLLSIISRSAVVQTMSYDGSGRLSSVVDSFGHQLVLTYDANGRLSSVTQQ